MKKEEESQRKHPRIAYNGRVDLIFADREITGCEVRNLCLSGMWIVGCMECTEGESCDVYFHDAGFVRSRTMLLKGQVSRREKDGIAIALIFKDMNLRAYTNLQTMMENYSEITFEEADGFLEELENESP